VVIFSKILYKAFDFLNFLLEIDLYTKFSLTKHPKVEGSLMTFKMDEIDKRILEKLQNDARVAFRKIAEELEVSESTIFVRVKKLQERGIIKRFMAEISPELVGKGLTAFILIKADPQKYPVVLETLKKIPDVYEIYDVTGNYYAIAKVRTGERGDLAKIIDQIGLIEGVTSTETAIVLRNIKEETRINL